MRYHEKDGVVGALRGSSQDGESKTVRHMRTNLDFNTSPGFHEGSPFDGKKPDRTLRILLDSKTISDDLFGRLVTKIAAETQESISIVQTYANGKETFRFFENETGLLCVQPQEKSPDFRTTLTGTANVKQFATPGFTSPQIGPPNWTSDFSYEYRLERLRFCAVAAELGFDLLVSDSPLFESGDLIKPHFVDVVSSKEAVAVIGLHSRIKGSLFLRGNSTNAKNRLFRTNGLYHAGTTIFTSRLAREGLISEKPDAAASPLHDLMTRFVHLLKSRDLLLVANFSRDDESIYHDIRYQFDVSLLMMGAVLDSLAHCIAQVGGIDPGKIMPTFTNDTKFRKQLKTRVPEVAAVIEGNLANKTFLKLHGLLRRSIHRNTTAQVGYKKIGQPPVELLAVTSLSERERRFKFRTLGLGMRRGFFNDNWYFPAIEMGDTTETLLDHCIRFCDECFVALNKFRGVEALPATKFRSHNPEYLGEVAALLGIDAFQLLIPTTKMTSTGR